MQLHLTNIRQNLKIFDGTGNMEIDELNKMIKGCKKWVPSQAVCKIGCN